MGEWVSEWVSVSEGAGGGGRRKADTELKTKTPHVNVGNQSGARQVVLEPIGKLAFFFSACCTKPHAKPILDTKCAKLEL